MRTSSLLYIKLPETLGIGTSSQNVPSLHINAREANTIFSTRRSRVSQMLQQFRKQYKTNTTYIPRQRVLTDQRARAEILIDNVRTRTN